MNRLRLGVLGWVVASTGIVGYAGLVAGSGLAILKLKTSILPGGVLQQAYSASVSVTGGRPPYVWGIISGQLPPGLALSTVNGGISGTPLQTGTFTFSVQVTDSTGHSDSNAYSVKIASAPAPNPAPTISGASPNSGPTSGGTAVTISGTNFQTGATVLFGGLGAVPVTILSATQIQVMTPTHIAGPVDVTVRNLDGQSATPEQRFHLHSSTACQPSKYHWHLAELRPGLTKDVKQLTEFYERVLQVKAQPSGDQYVEFPTSAGTLAIFDADAQEKYIPGAAQPGQNRSAILEFNVANVDQEYARLQGVVKTWVKPPTTQPWGSRSIYFRDPDGNLVDFFTRVKRQ